jgi:hypothetical protein
MALKSLNFTTLPPSSRNALDARRAKTVARLEEQKLLFQNPGHKRSVQRWVKINGQKSLIEKQQRVYPWWRTAADGSLVFFIRLAGKPVEFEKGKSGISVVSADKLPGVIDTLIGIVQSGELDAVLAQATKHRAIPKKKAA